MKPAILISLISIFPFTSFAKGDKKTTAIFFQKNVGQITDQYRHSRSDIDFKISAPGISTFIGRGEIHYQFHKSEKKNSQVSQTNTTSTVEAYRMDVALLNTNENVQIYTEGHQPYFEQYFIENESQIVESYTKVTYKNIYPSIDWMLYINDGKLEYEFIVHNGGNPSDIKLQYSGALSLALNLDGSLTAKTPMGTITEAAPYSYQEDGRKIGSSYILNDNLLTFQTESYKGKLVIDPSLVWATYYGSSASSDDAWAVACDDSGNVYLAGSTASTTNIATIGSHQMTYNGNTDNFLAKFDSNGVRLWGTYYGGSVDESYPNVFCDKFHNVYLSGNTSSPTNIATIGSHMENIAGDQDAYIAKFNSAGQRIWATYYGGAEEESSFGLSCDDSGNVIISGITASETGISTPSAHQVNIFNSTPDAFIAKFDSSGQLRWGTYYGRNSNEDVIYSVTTDGDCNVYCGGWTKSNNSNMVTPGAFNTQMDGLSDGIIIKFTPEGQRIWASYFGGSQEDEVASLIVKDQSLYITGYTHSTDSISTPGTHQFTKIGLNAVANAYLAKFDTSGTRLWGTYHGITNSGQWGKKIAVDNTNGIYIVHMTNSTTNISSPGTLQENYGGGGYDAYLAKFNDNGTREWSTYFGGCEWDFLQACDVDNNNNIYVAGRTESANLATQGSHQDSYAGNIDAILAKFNGTPYTGIINMTGDTLCEGSPATFTVPSIPGAGTYTWVLPGGWTGSSTGNTITVTTGTGTGTITVTGNTGCGTTTTQTIVVNIYPFTAPVVTQSGNVLTAPSGYTSYQWYNTTGAIPGETNQSYTITNFTETYYVIVGDTNGCNHSSGPIPVNVSNISRDNDNFIYPNPNDGSFTIEVNDLNNGEELTIEILDITGRTIKTLTEEIHSGSFNKTVNLGKDIPVGQYLLHIVSGSINRTAIFTKH